MAKAAPSRMPTPEDRVVLLQGKELFLRTEYTEHLRRLLKAAHGDCEFVKFDGATAAPAEVLDECRSFGLMATHKLVVVDDADLMLNQDTRPMFERYCDSPSDQATLVLRASTWRPGNLDKAIDKVGLVIKCDEIDTASAGKWVVRRAEKTHGVRLDPPAAAMLIDRTGTDLGRLDGELAKLAASAGPGGTITTQLITELVGLTREQEAWAIQSLLLSGDAPRMLKELRVIMGNGSKDVGVPVSFACCDLARKLMGAAEGMAQGAPPGKITKDLGLWGGSDRPIMDAARRLGPARARELFDAAIAVDAGIKSGLDTEIAIEVLALRFVAKP
jgi:DNA polymerase-3 subunit delta